MADAVPLIPAARFAADACALVDARGALSWREVAARADGIARALQRAAPGPDAHDGAAGTPFDRAPVAFVAPTTVESFLTLLALFLAGRVAAPLSPRLPAAARARLAASIGAIDLPQVEPSTTGAGAIFEAVPLARPLTVVWTSGSSGRPKAAVHAFGAHVASADGLLSRLPFGPGDRWLASLPLFHVGGLGLLVRAARAGGCLVVPEPGEPPSKALARCRPTHVSLVAAQLRALLDDMARDEAAAEAASELKVVLLGGGPCPPALLQDAAAAGLPIACSYGLTEMTSTVTATAAARGIAPAGAGRPLPGREVRVSDEGEVLVRGGPLFSGYLEEGALRLPLDEDGFFRTRDAGLLDEDGALHVKGRLDSMFISGGENVHPEEIEEALSSLPGVREAVVVAVEDPRWGARPHAFVRALDDAAIDEDAIRGALREILPGFKVPDAVRPFPEGPPGGWKPDRAALARLAAQARLAAPPPRR